MVGVAVGTRLAVAAVLLHFIGHGLGKSVFFCTSGRILSSTGTSSLAGVRGLLSSHPVTGGVFAVGLAALVGLPPFSLFASEVALVRATVSDGLAWVAAAVLALVLLAFVGMVVRVTPMLLGGAPGSPVRTHESRPARAHIPLLTGLTALGVVGVLSWPLANLLDSAALAVGAR
jgi:hydrogenase-4 component F